ncbi:MAG: phosphotransferase [Candidatus Krumholzibacteria bacterium]|nr:phosphotransferase [Candidatus Krumholzibacteria bacterium]
MMTIDPRMQSIAESARDLARRSGLDELACGATLSAVAEGGSDRRFFRLAGGGRTAVVLSQPGGGWELDSYVELARFLARFQVGAPGIYAFDRESGIILMEDLGDVHLEKVLETASHVEEETHYARALDILVELETSATAAMTREGLLRERLFDEATLLGETDYFMREFVAGFCPVPVPESWERERQLIASTLARERPVFMHRDYQCRNIMLKDDRLRIVDFQTAHRGPGVYDAASLLKDAYHPLRPGARRRLLEEFHAKLQARGARRGERFDEFYRVFTLAGVQRNMQALAAFVKLGARKGKTGFLESIPSGIDLLEEGVRESGRLPGLEALVASIRSRLRSVGKEGNR